MSAKKQPKRSSRRGAKPLRCSRNKPQFEVTCKFLLPTNEEQFRETVEGPRWKNVVRKVLYTLVDWRDYAEGEESKAYDNAVKYLRGELADNGLTLAVPELVEEGYRRARKYWAKAIAKRRAAAEMPEHSPVSRSGAQVQKLVSSGENQATKAALDFALEHGLAHAGWCKPGRPSEEGPLDEQYHVSEMPEATAPEIAERNILEADATVVVTVGAELGRLTRVGKLAEKHGKPWLHVAGLPARQNAPAMFREFLDANGVRVLNVLAPTSMEEPDAAHFVRTLLSKALLPNCE